MTDDTHQSLEVGDRTVSPGEKTQFRYAVGTTFNDEPIEFPATVTKGDISGPIVFLTAAVDGDELDGIKVVQGVATEYEPRVLHAPLVYLHALNAPGFLAQQRYITIYDEDLNRSLPGSSRSTTAKRLANAIYEGFISNCDLGLEFHTATRNRTTMYPVRADMHDPAVERLARAFGTSVILDGEGSDGTLRKVASEYGIPTVPVEMGWGPYPLVEDGKPLFTNSDHFENDVGAIRAPSTGLVVGVLENAVAYPGHPLCHFVSVDEATAEIVRDDIERGVFDVYRGGGFQWPVPRRYAHHEHETDSAHAGNTHDTEREDNG